MQPGDEYFSLRLDLERCVAFRYLGRVDEAAACFATASQRLELLGERAELAGVLVNLAEARLALGDAESASTYTDRATSLVEGPDSAMLHGRIALLRGDIRLELADIGGALSELDSALRRFDEARAEGWASSTRIRVAWMYLHIGAIDESYRSLEQVFRRNNVVDHPRQVAGALFALAHTELRDGRVDPARRFAAGAASIYERLGMESEVDTVRTLRARIELVSGNPAAAVALRETARPHPLTSDEWSLISGHAAVSLGGREAAVAALSDLEQRPLPLRQALERTRLRARLALSEGQHVLALSGLRDAKARTGVALARIDNPLLRTLLFEQFETLRATAMELVLDCISRRSAPDRSGCPVATEEVWNWLAREAQRTAEAPAARSASPFDRAVAQELLGRRGSARDVSALDELLPLVAGQTRGGDDVPIPAKAWPLEAFARRLSPGTSMIAWLDAGSETVGLHVSADGSTVFRTVATSVLRGQVATLLRLVADPRSPVAEIERAADELSKNLFVDVPLAAPTRLWIHADSTLDALPWTLLRWPGRAETLLDTTTVSVLRPSSRCCDDSSEMPDQISVVQAPQLGGTEKALARLATAAGESRLLAAGAHSVAERVRKEERATREYVLELLRTDGGWVHFAGHGTTHAQKLGYSGIWLESQAGGAAEFLGSLEISRQPIHSALVVLDACRLDERSAGGVRARLSFARTLANAGARNVVAAMWPVSDAAASVWVPTFYSDLAREHPPDPARALAAAQRALRDTRAFRHPYYWAGFVHRANR